MRSNPFKFLLTVSLTLPRVLAWREAGHEIVATIAQIHLHPSVNPALCSILNITELGPSGHPECALAPIATWADKHREEMPWSSELHFVESPDDYPPSVCAFPGMSGWAGKAGVNVLAGIHNVTSILAGWRRGRSRGDHGMIVFDGVTALENEALKFLVHFLGDLHQPLHLAYRAQGGNGINVRFGGQLANFHYTWDGLLVAKAIRETPAKWSQPLPSRQVESALYGAEYDAYVRRIIVEGVQGRWADEVSSWVSCPAAPTSMRSQQTLDSKGRLTGGTAREEEMDDDVLCPHHWAEPIHQLNCDFIWPKELDEPPYSPKDIADATGNVDDPGPVYLELDTPEYAGEVAKRMIVEKSLAQAGVRLAAILNRLFTDLGSN